MKHRGTQKVVVTGEDFGPAVKKTIIKLNQVIDLIDMNNLKVIEEKNRCSAGTSVPGHALFLVDIGYPDDLFAVC